MDTYPLNHVCKTCIHTKYYTVIVIYCVQKKKFDRELCVVLHGRAE